MATETLTLPSEAAGARLGEGVTAPSAIGRSLGRRITAFLGQYALLIVLAAIVLAPIFFTLLQALSSPPLAWVQAGKPLHPVAVEWKDRGWFTGGAFSVTVRSLLVLAALLWIQLRLGGGSIRNLRPLASLRRVVAVAAGLAAVMALTGPVFTALLERSDATAGWFVLALVVVAATQSLGCIERRRAVWRVAALGALAGAAVVTVTVVAVGAQVWTLSWSRSDLGQPLLRSFTVASLITVAQVVTSILTAYAFAFLRFPLKGLFFAFFIGTLLLPLEVTLLGNVQTIRNLGWINSTQALVLPFAAYAIGTFLIRQGFRGLPSEIRDATRLDGYGHMSFLWRFAVPLTRPVIAAFTVIAALGAWNQYLWPQAVIDQDTSNTAQIALRTLRARDITEANLTIAAALIISVPVLLLLIAFSRQIIRGLTAGAVKG